MPKLKFTARGIAAIKPPKAGQVDYWDASIPGFVLRITYAGRKTWCVVYRHESRKRRLTLGTYPSLSLADARERAKDALQQSAHGNDPAADKQAKRKAETLGELAAEYIEKHAKKNKRSWRTDELAFKRDILPRWQHRKAASITRKEVVRLLDDIVERGAPIQANRVLEILRKAYNWAISRDIVIYNPCIGIERPVKERARDRVLTDDEIKAVWAALADEDPVVAAAYKLRLLTAQRGQEVETMRIEDIDRESGWWTIPAERSKNERSHRVPLSAQTVKVLDELLAGDDRREGWVFYTALRDGPMTMLWRTKRNIAERAGVSFVPHDLRRSAASKMTGMGIPRLTVSKLLNHAEAGITKVYDRHSYDPEKRQALEAWGARLMEIVTGKIADENVVSLRRS